MEEIRVQNVPSTIVCSKAAEDIKRFLEEIMNEQGISADLMCMVLRDTCSYFERMRANDYSEMIVRQMAQIELYEKEIEGLKHQLTDLLNTEDTGNDNSENQS